MRGLGVILPKGDMIGIAQKMDPVHLSKHDSTTQWREY